MKKTIFFILSGAVALAMVSCAKEINETSSTDPVSIVVSMDPETKATLADDVTGAFAFSNGDAIKIYDGTAVYSGTTTSTTNTGSFSMPAEFNVNGSGLAGFPASLVSTISGSGVTFILPSSYEYSEVGGADPDAAKVSCPMIGSYTGSGSVSLKQAGSVVRFKVTNIAAGSLSFTFPTKVTGQVTLASVPESTGDGILEANLSTKGNTITISNVPAVEDDSFIYITLPVPTATAPQNILVTNEPSNASRSRVASIAGSATALNRAGGYKLAATATEIPYPTFQVAADPDRYVVLAPGNLMAKISAYHYDSTEPAGGYAEASEWKFGSAFEYVGDGEAYGNYLFANAGEEDSVNALALIDQWVDLFSWQGSSAEIKAHGLSNYTALTNVKKWCGDEDENLYDGCWNGLTITNGGEYSWRPMTKDEMEYLLKTRGGSIVGTENNARHGRATVAGVKGLLLFPDGITWKTTAQGGSDNCGSDALNTAMTAIADSKGVPTNLNVDGASTYLFTISYEASDFATMSKCGIVFLPAAGFHVNGNFRFVGEEGRFWTSSSRFNEGEETKCHVGYMRFDKGAVNPIASIMRMLGQSVRLVRDVE